MVVFMYSGHTPGKWQLHADSLPPGWTCIVCSNGKPPDGQPLPPNFILADKEAFTPDLVRSSAHVLCSIPLLLSRHCSIPACKFVLDSGGCWFLTSYSLLFATSDLRLNVGGHQCCTARGRPVLDLYK